MPMKTQITVASEFIFLPNALGQTRSALARNVRLGAHSVTVQIVVCGAWFGSVFFSEFIVLCGLDYKVNSVPSAQNALKRCRLLCVV
jgi:hypothetical protein